MKLQSEMFAVLDRSPAKEDRRFCDDARDAVASAARNIAEGFGRYGDAEFAKFVNIAIGSLTETYTNLVIATDRRYLSVEESKRLLALCSEATATTVGLLKMLKARIENKKRLRAAGRRPC